MSVSILHLISSFHRSGSARQMELLVGGLPSGRYAAWVAALGPPGPAAEALQAAGATVSALGRRAALDPIALGRLDRIVATARPALLQAWDAHANLYP